MTLRWFWLQMQRRQSSRMLRELTDEQLGDIGQRRSSNGKISQRPGDRLD